jgi:electron transfer flavoprotein alpha subunit
MKIGVYLENKKPNTLASVGLELISESRRQLDTKNVEIVGVWIGSNLEETYIKQISASGANRLIVCENEELLNYDTIRYTKILEDIHNNEHFDILLIGSSIIGRDLAPRLSARLKTGLTADATKLNFELKEESILLLATRPALGGNLFATIICPKTTPQMATIRPGVFAYSIEYKNNLIIDKHNYTSTVSLVKILKLEKKLGNDFDLTKAQLIISGGRGVANNFNKIVELANLLGVEYASSRALVDLGINTKNRLVGQTGTTVRPKIYLCFGISGAIQHIAGMDKSERIIAINNDPLAPIFDVADVGIVADANLVLSELLSRVKKHKENM